MTAENLAQGTELENSQRAEFGKSEEEWKETIKESRGTTQACVCHVFLNGIPVQLLSSLLPLSSLFVFHCGILIFFNFLSFFLFKLQYVIRNQRLLN